MEILFNCPNCRQQLEADSGMSGSEIECPTCHEKLTIPEADPVNLKVHANAGVAKEEQHFKVPVRETPSEVLIQKPKPPLDVAAKEGDKQLRIKTIKRSDCIEVGHDKFDEMVTEVLAKIGEANIVSIHSVGYQHMDLGSRQMINDFGIMIIYRG